MTRLMLARVGRLLLAERGCGRERLVRIEGYLIRRVLRGEP